MSDQPQGPRNYRPVFGYEEGYEVSSDGVVRSKITNKILKPQKITRNNNTYLFVNLYKKGKFKAKAIHKIVALTYLGFYDGLEVNHKDENTFNNNVDNLEWVTHQRNIEYSVSKTYTLKAPSGDVVEIFNLEKFARDNNLDPSNLSKVYFGKRKHHKGWTTING